MNAQLADERSEQDSSARQMSLFRCIGRPLNDHIDCLDILGRNVDDSNFYMDRNKSRCRIPRQQNVDLSGSSLDRGHGVVLVVCRYRLDRSIGLPNRGNRVLVEALLSFLLIFLPFRLDSGAELLFSLLLLFLKIVSRSRRGLRGFASLSYAIRLT